MIQNVVQSLSDMSIKRKLFISYLLLLAFSFGILIIFNFVTSSRDYQTQAINESEREVEQTANFLSYKLSLIKNSIDLISTNDTVINLCLKDSNDYVKNPGQWMVDNNNFSILIQSLEVNPDLSTLSNSSDCFQLYMNSGMASVYDSSKNYFLMSSAKKQSWYSLLEGKGSIFVKTSRDGKNYISYIRRISREQNVADYIGIIKVDIPEDSISTILNQATPNPLSKVMLLSNIDLLFGSEGNLQIVNQQIKSYVTTFVKSGDKAMHESINLDNGKQMMFLHSIDVDNTTWTFLLFVPLSTFYASSFLIMRQVVTIFLLLVPLTFSLSYFISDTATKRIRALSSHMKNMRNGNFDVQILKSGNDEIGTLIKNYNVMLTRISMLMDEKYQLGEKVKGLELKALQAQINPHFLYNTLDLVNLMSLKYNAPQIGIVIRSISKFYKISLSNGNCFISVKDELEHINAYVLIQNMRFTNQIVYKNLVAESLYEYEIVKTVLQPIVENAIIHGILEKDSEMGTITISGEEIGGDIFFYVKDDGVGISPEILNQLLKDGGKKSTNGGYGLRNVNDRLKMNYGKEYGLTCESKVGLGTTVTVKIKAVKNESPQ